MSGSFLRYCRVEGTNNPLGPNWEVVGMLRYMVPSRTIQYHSLLRDILRLMYFVTGVSILTLSVLIPFRSLPWNQKIPWLNIERSELVLQNCREFLRIEKCVNYCVCRIITPTGQRNMPTIITMEARTVRISCRNSDADTAGASAMMVSGNTLWCNR